ncbi:MAG: DNA-directed RNA polymerase subunit K [Candidatus Asgardarchaeia archaeon]
MAPKNKNPSSSSLYSEAEIHIEIGPPWLTRFEVSRIIGTRALQLSMGAPVLIEVPKGFENPIKIAEYEFKQGILPISIRRTLPDGKYQDIPLKVLLNLSRKHNIMVE